MGRLLQSRTMERSGFSLRLPGIVAVVFAALAIVYSLYSGWRAKVLHQDMPYRSRQEFESITPYVLGTLGTCCSSLQACHMCGTSSVTSRVPRHCGFCHDGGWRGPGAVVALHAEGRRGGQSASVGGACRCGFGDLWDWSHRVRTIGHGVRRRQDRAGLRIVGSHYRDCRVRGLRRLLRGPERNHPAPVLPRPPDGGVHAGHRRKGVPIGKRANKADAGRLRDMCDPANPKAPYHLICAHLVLTRINRRGVDPKWLDRWRIRGGDSFVFSPRYCGGHAVGLASDGRQTRRSVNCHCQRSMAASGAAVNPDAASSASARKGTCCLPS